MKEALGTARNLTLVAQEDGSLLPMVECIVIYTEPQFNIAKEGLMKSLGSGTLRFVACPEVLRAMSEQFATWADEADELADRYEHDVQGVATEDGSRDRGAVQQPGQ